VCRPVDVWVSRKMSGILDLYADELKIVVYMFRKFVQKIKKILE
jgi:hypothetical protein